MDSVLHINLSARRLAGVLLGMAAALAIAHVISVVAWYRDLLPTDNWLYISFFDLDEEESIGTWFSALILLLAGQLCWLQARMSRHSQLGQGAWWMLLAVGFHLLSLDEVAGFHEFVNTVVKGTHWTTFGAAIGLLVGVGFIPFLKALPPRTRYLFVVSGAIFLGGAVGVEWGTIWYEEQDLLDTLPYNLWNALEEFLEMAGVILFIYSILEYIARDGRIAAVNARLTE